MKNGRMQCKDIPDVPVLEFIDRVEAGSVTSADGYQLRSSCWFWSEDCRPENSVQNAMPDGVYDNLRLAKMKMLMRAGLVDGCACGCRGDFTLTDAGRKRLATERASMQGAPQP